VQVLKKRTFEHLEKIDVPSSELDYTLHNWKRTNLGRRILSDENGNYHLNSNNMHTTNRAAQTGVFDLDIRISNRPFIDVCKSFAAETGLKCRNVEKRINAV
jgi:hypothetical protein